MGTSIKSALDHPLFGPGHTDNRASALVADGIGELGRGINNCIRKFNSMIEGHTS